MWNFKIKANFSHIKQFYMYEIRKTNYLLPIDDLKKPCIVNANFFIIYNQGKTSNLYIYFFQFYNFTCLFMMGVLIESDFEEHQ